MFLSAIQGLIHLKMHKFRSLQEKGKVVKKYGTEATFSAFEVSRATIYRLRKDFKDSGGRLESPVSKPRIAKRKRQKQWDERIF